MTLRLTLATTDGFGGLDITDEGIVQRKTALPKGWKSLTIMGVGVEGKKFDAIL